MSGPDLKEPFLKVARAKSHIEDVKRQCFAFTTAKPYRIFAERDSQGSGYTVKLRLDAPIPDEISIVVGEALYQLRSALDVLACCLAEANGAKDTKGTYFPFAKNATDFVLPATQRKIQKLSAVHQKVISQWQPYEGGDEVLLSLNQLSNMDRHNRLVAVGGMTGPLHSLKLTGGQYFVLPPKRQTLDQDVILIIGKSGPPPEGEVRIGLDITFREIKLVEGKPVVAVLYLIADRVEWVLKTFDTLG